ncbi:hypothetical protein U1Q18_016255 [Sarracenia purpurea var. burkii]
MIGSRLVDGVDNVFERRLERERLIYPHPVGERQPRAAAGSAVGQDEGDELGSEGVEVVGGFGFKEGEQLVKGWAFGSGGDQAENDMDRQRREYQVRILGFVCNHLLCDA